MSTEVVLGIDIGTSASKGCLVRLDGTIVAESRRAHALSLPRPGWAEHDAESVWWSDLLALIAELAPVASGGLRAICVSGIGPCALPCDANNRPLRPAILYGIDTRASDEIDQLNALFGEQSIIDRCGSALSSQATGPKLLWIRTHEPEVWEKFARWYMASSFAVARLTGEYVLDRHSASQADPLYDMHTGSWADDWAAEMLPGLKLPRLAWPGDQVGFVTPQAALETGLPAGTPVVVGTIDAWVEALSAGVRDAGDVMLMYASTTFLIQVGSMPAPAPPLWLTEGLEPGRKDVAAGMSTTGLLAEWVRATVGDAAWPELLREAEATPPGSDGLLLLPYFAGERTPVYDPNARGLIAGLSLSHRRGHILRAAYEGIAFGISQILMMMERAAGPAVRVVAVGGGTQSELWLQTVSDVCGIPQLIPASTIGASFGDALLAATGLGLVDQQTNWAEISRVVEPKTEHTEIYERLRGMHQELYLNTSEIMHQLVDLGSAPT